MGRTMTFVLGGVLIAGALFAALIFSNWDEAVKMVAMGVNYVRYMGAPAGTISSEVAPPSKQSTPIRLNASAPGDGTALGQDGWASYNKTLTSNRFSPLNQITTAPAISRFSAPTTRGNTRDLRAAC
jgi:alcohol dehydrogenase (cytochrome c)